MITALALMIAVAGYLNYSGYFKDIKNTTANNTLSDLNLLDISLEDMEEVSDIEETPGEAVLTSGTTIVASAKITREQVRAQNKETLLDIINNEGTCMGLRNQIAILANGDVVPCCLDSEACILLGNIFETSLEDILNSEKSQNIIKGFQNGKLIGVVSHVTLDNPTIGYAVYAKWMYEELISY
mgnify:CR=1 FL=1